MDSVFRTPDEKQYIESPTICHGQSELLQITLGFANESTNPIFKTNLPRLVSRVLAKFDSNSIVGFRNIEANGVETDNPGLLDGAMGTALALLGCISDASPTWDRVLLIS